MKSVYIGLKEWNLFWFLFLISSFSFIPLFDFFSVSNLNPFHLTLCSQSKLSSITLSTIPFQNTGQFRFVDCRQGLWKL
ncbi:hypothetical protein DFH28DRAFT_702509 [Melampsora americana]|nr:hypothetical protein DFH28DRAFT_702509 [Melampsora americana]